MLSEAKPAKTATPVSADSLLANYVNRQTNLNRIRRNCPRKRASGLYLIDANQRPLDDFYPYATQPYAYRSTTATAKGPRRPQEFT